MNALGLFGIMFAAWLLVFAAILAVVCAPAIRQRRIDRQFRQLTRASLPDMATLPRPEWSGADQ